MRSRTLTITPHALELFKEILFCNTWSESDTDKRLRIAVDLGVELKLETWEFFLRARPLAGEVRQRRRAAWPA